MRQTSLFPLTLRPTTRDIADSVKEGGVANLPDAMRKADAATYQEVRCRSALNRVKGMPFEWTLNPYRGCTHGCHYCFARRYHTQFELDADDSFASVILVKVNFIEVLSKELSRERWDRDTSVALGTATDPYQPIEGQYKLTRGAIVELGASKTPFGIVTNGSVGKCGCTESTTASETAMHASRRSKTRRNGRLDRRIRRYSSGTTLWKVPTVTGPGERRIAVTTSMTPKGLWTWTTSKRRCRKTRSSVDASPAPIVNSVSPPFT